MNQKDFDAAIRRLVRRAELLRQAQAGSVKLRRVDVGKATVREHVRQAHSRWIAPAGWKVKVRS